MHMQNFEIFYEEAAQRYSNTIIGMGQKSDGNESNNGYA